MLSITLLQLHKIYKDIKITIFNNHNLKILHTRYLILYNQFFFKFIENTKNDSENGTVSK